MPYSGIYTITYEPHAAMFGNRLQMPVTRSGHILGRLARHATRTNSKTCQYGHALWVSEALALSRPRLRPGRRWTCH